MKRLHFQALRAILYLYTSTLFSGVTKINDISPRRLFFKNLSNVLTDQNILYALAISVFLPYPLTMAIVLMVTVLLLCRKKHRERLFVHKGSKALLPFFALALIMPVLYRHWVGLGAGILLICIAIIGLFARSALTVKIYEHMLDIITMLSVPIGIAVIIERIFLKIFDPNNQDYFRCVSVFFNANYFATVVATVVIICAYKAGTHQGFRPKYFIIAGLNMISAYLSGSLFVWVEIFVGVSLVFFLLKKHEMISGLLLGGGLFCFLIYFAPGLFLPRLGEAPVTTDRRIDIWRTALRAFFDSPLFGHGTLTYYQIYPHYEGSFPTSHAHNILLDPLLSFGLVGTALLAVYVVCTLWMLLKCLRGRSDGRITVLISAVTLAAAVHGTTDVTLLWVQTGLLFLLIVGGIDLAYRQTLRYTAQTTDT